MHFLSGLKNSSPDIINLFTTKSQNRVSNFRRRSKNYCLFVPQLVHNICLEYGFFCDLFPSVLRLHNTLTHHFRCRLRIVDKFFLCALDQKWHSSCLKCSQCGVPLEEQMAFFRHEDRLYCKEDYSK